MLTRHCLSFIAGDGQSRTPAVPVGPIAIDRRSTAAPADRPARLCGPAHRRRNGGADARHDRQQPAKCEAVRDHGKPGPRRCCSARLRRRLVFTDEHFSSDSIHAHANLRGSTGQSYSGRSAAVTRGTSGGIGAGDSESSHIAERKHEAVAAVRLVGKGWRCDLVHDTGKQGRKIPRLELPTWPTRSPGSWSKTTNGRGSGR